MRRKVRKEKQADKGHYSNFPTAKSPSDKRNLGVGRRKNMKSERGLAAALSKGLSVTSRRSRDAQKEYRVKLLARVYEFEQYHASVVILIESLADGREQHAPLILMRFVTCKHQDTFQAAWQKISLFFWPLTVGRSQFLCLNFCQDVNHHLQLEHKSRIKIRLVRVVSAYTDSLGAGNSERWLIRGAQSGLLDLTWLAEIPEQLAIIRGPDAATQTTLNPISHLQLLSTFCLLHCAIFPFEKCKFFGASLMSFLII